MMMDRRKLLVLASAAAASGQAPDRVASLRELLLKLNNQADFRQLVPDERRLRRGLKPDVDPADVAAILKAYPPVAQGARLARPEQSNVLIAEATTEQIVSGAAPEFPGGAKQIAARLFRPGVTYYQAKFVEPGSTTGMAYHLFFWDGEQWTMLGPLWRMVRAVKGE